MAFDIEGARQEGHSDADIARHLSGTRGFDYDGAIKEGHTDADILGHLEPVEVSPVDAAPVEAPVVRGVREEVPAPEAEDPWPVVIGKGVVQATQLIPRTISEGGHMIRKALDMPESDFRKSVKATEKILATNVGKSKAKKYVGQAVRVGGEMLASGLTLPLMAASAGVTKGAEALDEEHSMKTAVTAAAASAATEYLTEKLPFDILLKPGTSFLKRLGQGLVADVPGEALATFIEMKGIDEQLLGKKYTDDELWGAVRDSMIVAGITTGGITAGTHPFVARDNAVTAGKKGVETDPNKITQDVVDELVEEGAVDKVTAKAITDEFNKQTSKELSPIENGDLLNSILIKHGVTEEAEVAEAISRPIPPIAEEPEGVIPEEALPEAEIVPEEVILETVEERVATTVETARTRIADTLDTIEPKTEMGAQLVDMVKEEVAREEGPPPREIIEEEIIPLTEEVIEEEVLPEAEVLPEITPQQRAYNDAALSLGIDTTGKATEQLQAEVKLAVEGMALPESDVVSPTERRADFGKRQEIEKLFAAGDIDGANDLIFQDPMTGNLNRRAFEHDEPRAIEEGKTFASIDMSGLKWVNDSFGHEFGDNLLKLMGESLSDIKDGNAYRIGGDEYVVIIDNKEQADIMLNRVREKLADTELEITLDDGSVRTFKGWSFDYATAENYAEADRKLTKFREELKAKGKRVGRGGAPLGLIEVTAQRIKDKAKEPRKEVAEEELPPPTAPLPFELNIKDGVVQLDNPNRQILEAVKLEVEAGEAGKRAPVTTPEGETIGMESQASTFPRYFQDKNYKKKAVLVALNKALGGRKLALGQEATVIDLHEGFQRTYPSDIDTLIAEVATVPAKEIAAEKAQVKIPTEPFVKDAPVKIGKSPQPHTIVKELEVTPEEIELGERFFEVKNDRTGEVSEVAIEDLTPIKRRISKKAHDKAVSNIKEKMKGLKAGIDPTLLKDYAVIGAYHFETGLRTFGAWRKQMIKDFGEGIKPHLRDLWNKAKAGISKTAPVVPPIEKRVAPKAVKAKAPEVKPEVEVEAPPAESVRLRELRKRFGAGPLPLKNTEEVYGVTSKEMADSNEAEANRVRNTPEIKTYTKEKKTHYKRFTERVEDSFSFLDPIGKLPEKAEYLKTRQLVMGRIAAIDQVSKDIYKTFSKATTEEATHIFNYLTDKTIKSSVIKDAGLRKEAEKVKQLIIETGQKLVDRKLLKQETFDEMKGAYLPQIYLRHLLPDDVIGAFTSGKKPSDMGWAKKRKDIPEDVKRLVLGQITNPGYLASKGFGVQQRDMAILDWLAEISENSKWVMDKALVDWKGHKVTAFWLLNEAEQIRSQAVHYNEKDKVEARKVADQMDEVVASLPADYKTVPKDFKRFPNTGRYGALRGLAVRKEIYDDIIGASTLHTGDTSVAEQILGAGGVATKMTQLWKWSKVAANPPGQVRNFVSNGILLHLSGVPFHKVPVRVIEAIRDIRKNGKYWKVAKKYGVTESTFGSQELMRIERELLDIEAKGKGLVSLATLRNIGGKIMDFTGDAYQLSESIFKTAKIIDEMKKGKGPDDAALEAQKWLFDYSLVTPSMRYLRNAPVGVPFLTFYLKALPRMLEVLLTNPMKFAPYMAIPAAMTAMIANMTDVDDDDVDKLRKALPKWLEEKGNAYILPAKDEQGRWQAIDIGYFLPWATWSTMASELGKGEIGDALMGTGLFGGPVPDLITAIKTNIDPFSKRPIVNKLDSPQKQIASMMGYLYQMAAPTWLTNIGFAGHMYRALSETVDKYGDPKTNVTQAALRLVGVNLYPIDPIRTRASNIKWMQFEISQVKRRRSSLLKDKNLSKKERKEIRTEYQGLINRRQKELREYKKESRVHPKLR